MISEGRSDNFFNTGWLWLFLLSLPWFLGFEIQRYAVVLLLPPGVGLVILTGDGQDWWHIAAAILSIAINSYLLYLGTRPNDRRKV